MVVVVVDARHARSRPLNGLTNVRVILQDVHTAIPPREVRGYPSTVEVLVSQVHEHGSEDTRWCDFEPSNFLDG